MSLNHHKLFYKDPYLKTFETKILKQQQDKKGDFYITLEETAFYPTGGGQPHDTGTSVSYTHLTLPTTPYV